MGSSAASVNNGWLMLWSFSTVFSAISEVLVAKYHLGWFVSALDKIQDSEMIGPCITYIPPDCMK